MITTTYSFADTNFIFFHPAKGAYPITGKGMGQANVTYPNDNTATDLAADGSVMITKIKADIANINIELQQTSPFHLWLLDYFNFLNSNRANTNQWAGASITIDGLNAGGTLFTAQNVAPIKRPDAPYQQQGQRITWSFVSGNASSQGVSNIYNIPAVDYIPPSNNNI